MTGAGDAPIGPARGDEIDALAALGAGALASAWGAEALAAARARPETRLWVARADGAPVAYLLGRVVADEVEILELVVSSQRRRRGIGSALVEHALGRARAEGARRAHLEVRAGDAVARGFYRERRFREIGRRARYYRDGEDAIAMSRSLAPPGADETVASVPEGPAR